MILLLGATGYVGQAFSQELRQRRLAFIPLTRKAVDYTNFDVLFAYVRKMKPEFVINAAGCAPNPNWETSKSAQWDILRANAVFPQTVARVCLMTNIPWAHVSSGSIYSGAKVEMPEGVMGIEQDLSRPEVRQLFALRPERFCGFTECDEPNLSFRRARCSFYSGSKALAEEVIRGMGRCYVWRLGTVFDERDDRRNLLSRLQRVWAAYDSIISVSELNDFVRACLGLWEAGAAFGIYNVVNAGAVTIDYIVKLARKILGPVPHIELLESGDQSEAFRGATQISCSNCILDTSKLAAVGVKMRSAKEALESSLRKWRTPAPLWADTTVAAAPAGAFAGVDAFERLFERET